MAGEEFTDLVRFRNDGEDFHINWTTRRALRILGGRDGLVAVAVEGISDRDRYKGRWIAEGLLVADTVEYHDGETLEDASLIVVNQLKYSTQHPDRPWSWSDVEPMMEQFAARYRKIARECGVATARSKLRFRFVTNRPISKNVLDAIDHLTGKSADPPKGHALTDAGERRRKLAHVAGGCADQAAHGRSSSGWVRPEHRARAQRARGVRHRRGSPRRVAP